MLGADRPFVVCDPHRRNMRASVRSPTNHKTGVAAFRAARGGSLCIRRKRLPADFSSVVSQVRNAMIALTRDPEESVHFIVCADARFDSHPFLALPAPIRVPSLRDRASELPRIVDEYARDAIAALSFRDTCFTAADRAWVLEHGASSLSEIEKATLRLVALRASRNMSDAAARLGMAPVSLQRWLDRRKFPPSMLARRHDQKAVKQKNENQ
jgi:hypothetical protein